MQMSMQYSEKYNCPSCEEDFNNEQRKPLILFCGETICETCHDSFVQEDGRSILCPIHSQTHYMLKVINQKIVAQITDPINFCNIVCDDHPDQRALIYSPDTRRFICHSCSDNMSSGEDDRNLRPFSPEALRQQIFTIIQLFEQSKATEETLIEKLQGVANTTYSFNGTNIGQDIHEIGQYLFRNKIQMEILSELGLNIDYQSGESDQATHHIIIDLKSQLQHQITQLKEQESYYNRTIDDLNNQNTLQESIILRQKESLEKMEQDYQLKMKVLEIEYLQQQNQRDLHNTHQEYLKEQQIQELQQTNDTLQKNNSLLQDRVDSLSNDIQILNDKIQELNNEHARQLAEKTQESIQIFKVIKDEKQELTEENFKLNQQIVQLTNEIDLVNQQKEQLISDQEQRQKETLEKMKQDYIRIQELVKEKEDIMEKQDYETKQNETQKRQIVEQYEQEKRQMIEEYEQNLNDKLQESNEDMMKLIEEKEQLIERLEHVERENKSLLTQLYNANNDITKLNDKMYQLSIKLEGTDNQREEATNKLNDIRESHAKLADQKEEIENINMDLYQKIEELKSQLEYLQNKQ